MSRSILNAMAKFATTVTIAIVVVMAHFAFAQPADGIGQSEALVRQGAEELSNGNTGGAAELFHRALRLNPNNADAHTYLAVIADQQNDLGSAEKHFAAAVAAQPGLPSTHNNLGTVLLKLGKNERAISEFEKSLRLDRNQPEALLNLGQAYFNRGTEADLRQAHDLFARSEQLHPDPAAARAVLVTSIKRKEANSAAAEYAQYKVAIVNARPELAGGPARLEIGRSLLELGLTSDAVQELNAALAMAPDDSAVIAALGRAYRMNGQATDAGKLMESAVARGIKSGAIYAELAEVYDATGHVENAIPAMRLAIAADPSNQYFYLRYGLLLNDTNAPAAAVVRLEEAVKLFPESAAMRFALGLAYYADHKNQQAAECFEKAVALDENFAPAYAYRGLVFADGGNYQQAIEQYEKSVSRDPEVAVVHELMAEAMLRQPTVQTGRAEKELRRAIELDSTYVPAGIELAKLLQRQGKPELAARELERVVKINPKLPQPHYLLGRTYAALKRSEDSKREFELFQQLDKATKQAEVDARNDLLKRLANVRY